MLSSRIMFAIALLVPFSVNAAYNDEKEKKESSVGFSGMSDKKKDSSSSLKIKNKKSLTKISLDLLEDSPYEKVTLSLEGLEIELSKENSDYTLNPAIDLKDGQKISLDYVLEKPSGDQDFGSKFNINKKLKISGAYTLKVKVGKDGPYAVETKLEKE